MLASHNYNRCWRKKFCNIDEQIASPVIVRNVDDDNVVFDVVVVEKLICRRFRRADQTRSPWNNFKSKITMEEQELEGTSSSYR